MFRLKKSRSRVGWPPPPSPTAGVRPASPQESQRVAESDDVLDRLEAYWYPDKIGFISRRNPHASREEITAFEGTRSVKFPDDLRAYFLRFNGIDEDPTFFCFWPITRLAPVTSVLSEITAAATLKDADRYFVFADYGIQCNYCAIYLGDGPHLHNPVILPDFSNSPAIAPNFSAFLDLYLGDDPKLYGNA